MPIRFTCGCGKTLQVKDEYAGRRVKCPACAAVAAVPEPEPSSDGFEVVETPPPPPPKRRRPWDDDEDDGSAGGNFEVVDEPKPRSKPPKKRRGSYEEEEEKRLKKRARENEKLSGGSLEGKVFNGGVVGGFLAMLVAVVWFVGGLFADIIFFYPPVLFLIGLVGFVRGLAGGGDE